MRDMAQLRLQVGGLWLLSKHWQNDAPEMSETGKGGGRSPSLSPVPCRSRKSSLHETDVMGGMELTTSSSLLPAQLLCAGRLEGPDGAL